MKNKPTASHTLGLELGPFRLKGASLIFQRGKPALDRVIEIDIDQEKDTSDHVKLLYKDCNKQDFSILLHKSLVVTAMPTSEVLVRKLTVPLSKDRDIDAVLDFQAEPLLPYPIENGVIDSITLEKNEGKTSLSILAVRTDHLSQHLKQWQTIPVEPEVVACVPNALTSFSTLFSPSKEAHFILHLGMTETTCILTKQGKLLASQSSQIGLINLIEAFAADTEVSKISAYQQIFSLDFSSVTKDLSPQLFQMLQKLHLEVARFLLALVKQVQAGEVQEILITGEGGTISYLPEMLCENMKKTLIFPEENPHFSLTQKELQKYSAPIGMGLTALPQSTAPINFRQKEFVYPFPWKRIKKVMATYLTLCLVLSGSLFLFGNVMIANQEQAIKEKYLDLLVFMQKPFYEFESQFHKKEINEGPLENEKSFDTRNLTAKDLRVRLNVLEKEIRKAPNTFPLLANTPRVSDVLVWLSTHPHIVGENQGKPKIQLESFQYKIVKRPYHKKKNEKYQVKIELEFSSPIPRYAREFHDILLEPNNYVDPKGEIKWSGERGKYRTSFLLKDKTIYPITKKR